jgi:hypothetical protein
MQERQQFCGSCGKLVAPAMRPARRGRVAAHLISVAILWIVYSAMHLMGGVFLGRALPLARPWGRTAAFGWPHAPFFLHGPFFPMLGGMVLLVSVLGIIAGLGLLARRPWARTMSIVGACFMLLAFPFGTALGIYTLWVLAPSECARQYREAA